MLPGSQKLHLNKDFDQVFKTGRSLYGRFLGVKVLKNQLKEHRFAIILGLKIDKSAVKRHYYKRRLFNLVAVFSPKLPFPLDCVIIALPALKEAKVAELKQEIDYIFSKIREIL